MSLIKVAWYVHEKYAYEVALKLLCSLCEEKLSIVHYIILHGKAELPLSKVISKFHCLPSANPKQSCALALIRCFMDNPFVIFNPVTKLDKEKYPQFLTLQGNCGTTNQTLVDQIHGLGMTVYAYTFKNEQSSMCWDHLGDVRNELDRFYELGLDGYFADYPNTVRSFLDDQNCIRSGYMH